MFDKQIIIKRPIITEKSFADASRGIFTFEADKQANKHEIASEIEKLFPVHVVAVTSEILKGKKRRTGRARKPVQQPDFKKVRIKLRMGEKIPLFEVGASK